MQIEGFDKFNKTYCKNRNWYITCEDNKKARIIESKDEKYTIQFNYKPASERSICFRIENYKKEFLGNERKGAPDNDVTVLDDDIYQIEIKDTKRIDHQKVLSQFQNGWQWVHHLLWVADHENMCNLKRKYDILIHLKIIDTRNRNRGMSRKPILNLIKNEDCRYTVIK